MTPARVDPPGHGQQILLGSTSSAPAGCSHSHGAVPGMSRACLVPPSVSQNHPNPTPPPASRCGALAGAAMGLSPSAPHRSAAQAAGRALCYSHLHIQRGKSCTPGSQPSPCPPCQPLDHYLLAGRHVGECADAAGVRHHHGRGEARGVGILGGLLLVCVHCGQEGHRSGKSHPSPRHGTSRDGNGQQGDGDGIKQARGRAHRFPPSHCILRQLLTPRKPWGLRGCGWTRGRKR